MLGPIVDVSVSAVVGYLGLNGKLFGLIKYAATPPATAAGISGAELVAIINCPNAPAFVMSNATTYATVQGMLNALAGDSNSGITTTDAANLLALAQTPQIPWCQANGYLRAFDLGDIAEAGLS